LAAGENWRLTAFRVLPGEDWVRACRAVLFPAAIASAAAALGRGHFKCCSYHKPLRGGVVEAGGVVGGVGGRIASGRWCRRWRGPGPATPKLCDYVGLTSAAGRLWQQVDATMTIALPKKALVVEKPTQARILQFRAWHGSVPGVRRASACSLTICRWESGLAKPAGRSAFPAIGLKVSGLAVLMLCRSMSSNHMA
jgi:hypothetical protein